MNTKFKELAYDAGLRFSTTGTVLAGDRVGVDKFAELVWKEGFKEGVQNMLHANLANPDYAAAMDAYYESKWAHRFD